MYNALVMPIKITANYKSAFKDADIRGIYPTEIDDELTYLVARSFVEEFNLSKVLVARDMRLSSPTLHQAFLKGVTDAGAAVIDIGLMSTPMLYFASGQMDLPGVVITASHSPKNYNGLKLVLPGARPLTERQGLGSIRRRLEKGVFREVKKVGKVTTKDVSQAYQSFVLKGSKNDKLAGLNVVADCGNGMSSVIMPLLAEKLPVKFTTLFAELDGNMPSRGSDPTLRKNQKAIKGELKAKAYDFGIAFDGDADRIAFFDETGKYINCASIGAVIAKRILAKEPHGKIVYTNLTSRIYKEEIKRAGGRPVAARVGHAFIKQKMRKEDALFACEHSGHFYFKQFFYTDSVTLALRYVIEAYAEAKEQDLSFSAFMSPYIKYEQTEDVIVEVKDKHAALKQVRDWLAAKKPLSIKPLDGYVVDFGEVWGTVKISVTEHALKVMFEANKKAKAQALQDEVVAYIRSIA